MESSIKFIVIGLILFLFLLIFWGIYSLFHLVLHTSICILVKNHFLQNL